MADNGGDGSSVGVVAIVVIFLIVVLAALFVFRGRIFNRGTNVDINIKTPSSTAPSNATPSSTAPSNATPSK